MDSTKGTNEEIRAADEEVTAAADEIERCEVSANILIKNISLNTCSLAPLASKFNPKDVKKISTFDNFSLCFFGSSQGPGES